MTTFLQQMLSNAGPIAVYVVVQNSNGYSVKKKKSIRRLIHFTAVTSLVFNKAKEKKKRKSEKKTSITRAIYFLRLCEHWYCEVQ